MSKNYTDNLLENIANRLYEEPILNENINLMTPSEVFISISDIITNEVEFLNNTKQD
jgi:hypothetical protein